MEERDGRPGRRYDDMTQQNQSPVVTDAILLLLDEIKGDCSEHSRITKRVSEIETLLIEAALSSGGVSDDEETYQIGVRDGYEKAIQELDLATGGDGEFRGSTFPGETVDVPVMKSRIIERFSALEAALPSGVRVKPLEWVLDKPAMGDRYTAQSSFGEYTVRLKDGYMWEPGNESFPSTHDDPKAAAQADYERRILSSIEPAPSPSHAETVAPAKHMPPDGDYRYDPPSIAQALLEAEQRGWREGMEEAAEMVESLGFSANFIRAKLDEVQK